ncbi:MAG: hypothetical protein JWR81_6855 [Pseudonocardia sp.]|jgi:hypothetical protein|nr:hypothetical protein [Pseudonocardia sp.]
MTGVRAEVLVVPDCPNETTTVERLRQVLDETGRIDTPVEVHVVTLQTVPWASAFAGSPTVVIDGVDPFADQASAGAGLSCRVYRGPEGVSGAPSLEALRRVIGR